MGGVWDGTRETLRVQKERRPVMQIALSSGAISEGLATRRDLERTRLGVRRCVCWPTTEVCGRLLKMLAEWERIRVPCKLPRRGDRQRWQRALPM